MEHLAILVVMGFAAYRATQLVVWDTIADPLRNRIEQWHARSLDPATGRFGRVPSFVRGLISCTYCAGWWLSVATVLLYVTFTHQWDQPLIGVALDCWAVAGIQALLNRWDDSRPANPGQ